MQAGDHLISPRKGYSHHGIYVGHDKVIHYSGYAKIKKQGVIEVTSLAKFHQENGFKVKEHLHRKFTHKETVARAHTRLGENWYNILINNCEHFVSWCINGEHKSKQINDLIFCAQLTRKLIHAQSAPAAQKWSTQEIAKLAERGIHAVSSSTVKASTAKAMVSGLTGAGSSTLASIGGGSISAAGLLGISAGVLTPLAPIAVGVGVGALIDYGFKKLFD